MSVRARLGPPLVAKCARGLLPESQQALVEAWKRQQKLQHRNIQPVVEWGAGNGWIYCLRPIYTGPNWTAVCARAGPQQILDWVAQLAAALAEAHRQGVIHRALHRDNLLWDGSTVVITDFGLPRLPEAEVRCGPPLPLETVGCIAPEQILGGKMTPAADLYALGMLTYEALGGVNPMLRGDLMATLMAILQEEVPPLPGDFPRPLVELLAAMLAKDPARRLQDAGEVLQLLPRSLPGPKAEASDEVRSLVDELRGQATTVSRDQHFTLDAQKALEKLAAFQFVEPYDFLTPLLAAAAPLGARRLEVQVLHEQLILRYEAPELTATQIRELFTSAEAGLRHLARGLAGAPGQDWKVELHSGAHQALLAGLSHPRPQVRQAPEAGVTVVLSRRDGRFRLAPDDWALNQWLQRVSPRFVYSHALLGFQGQPLPRRQRPDWLAHLEVEGESFVVQAAVPGRHPGLYLMCDGMSFIRPYFPIPEVEVLVDGPFAVDLAYSAPVQGPRLHEVVQRATAAVTEWLVHWVAGRELDERGLNLLAYLAEQWRLGQDEGRYTEALRQSVDSGLKLGEDAFHPLVWQGLAQLDGPARLKLRRPYFSRLGYAWASARALAQQAGACPDEFLRRAWLEWGEIQPPVEAVEGVLTQLSGVDDTVLHRRLARLLESDPAGLDLVDRWQAALPAGYEQTRNWLGS